MSRAIQYEIDTDQVVRTFNEERPYLPMPIQYTHDFSRLMCNINVLRQIALRTPALHLALLAYKPYRRLYMNEGQQEEIKDALSRWQFTHAKQSNNYRTTHTLHLEKLLPDGTHYNSEGPASIRLRTNSILPRYQNYSNLGVHWHTPTQCTWNWLTIEKIAANIMLYVHDGLVLYKYGQVDGRAYEREARVWLDCYVRVLMEVYKKYRHSSFKRLNFTEPHCVIVPAAKKHKLSE